MSFLWGHEHCVSVVSMRRTEPIVAVGRGKQLRWFSRLSSKGETENYGSAPPLGSTVRQQDMRFSIAMTTATALAFMLLGCFDITFEPIWPHPGTIVAKSVAPDEAAVAMLIFKNKRGDYQFEIRDSGSGDTLARTTISAPIGYHEHVVSIHWVDTRRVEATIDRDFGDNNLKFTLSY